jgi:hypothetical protein
MRQRSPIWWAKHLRARRLMPDGSPGPLRDDPLRDVRRLGWWVRLFVYPAVTLAGLIYYYGLGLSLLATLVPLGVGYVIATATIEYAFAQMVRLRKQGIHQDILHHDAITSDRPYRKARPHEYALEEIRRNTGTQFDPQVVEAFLRAGIGGDIRDDSAPREHAVPLSYAAM